MNKQKLNESAQNYMLKKPLKSIAFIADSNERRERTEYYKSFTPEKMLKMSEAEFSVYISKLWAMVIWGNKSYKIDKLISQNGFQNLLQNLVALLWGTINIEQRWDQFRFNINGIGPAMMSELLCVTHPEKYLLWNSSTKQGLTYLEVKGLPKHDYQCDGKAYKQLCDCGIQIRDTLSQSGYPNADYLLANYFIWDELQNESKLTDLEAIPEPSISIEAVETSDIKAFIHNDIRDKLSDIGEWLGFSTDTEKKVAPGAQVDNIWQATIGNMGRVAYVFEVQTRGSIDSLILNLRKALNNPAVQGIVAVSDSKQLEKINLHAKELKELSGKFKTWDFQEVLIVHESLQNAFALINKLELVPHGF